MNALLEMEPWIVSLGNMIEVGNHVVDAPSVVSREAWREIFDRLHDLHRQIDAAWTEGMKGE